MKREISIIGGGLSGLALANGLRLADVPVKVMEAGHYPRHRVCGEFLAGLSNETISALGLESCFAGALNHQSSIWFSKGLPVRKYDLPRPVLGISRHTLDHRLAKLLRQRGGILHEGTRQPLEPAEGHILTCGRRAEQGGYFGLKGHWNGLETQADLELHLGKDAYVGLSAVEDGHVNVCGLFRDVATGDFPSPVDRLYATFSEHGLQYLAKRLQEGFHREGSFSSVSGLSYSRPQESDPAGLGDRHRLIPPFTGNGMTIAFEAAHKILPLAIDYAHGRMEWPEFIKKREVLLRKAFDRRYFMAGLIHPFLLRSRLQSLICSMARANLIPFRRLYQLTHR